MIRIAGAAACLLLATPAAARSVELLAFTPPGTGLPGEAPSRGAPTETTTALAQDFSDMAVVPVIPPPAQFPTKSSIQVPRWMQTGLSAYQTRFRIAPSPALPLLAATCSGAAYRPREDLPVSAEARRARLYPLVAQVACEAGIPAGLFDALVIQESRYRIDALSPQGAMGLSQLMPGTARLLGVANPWDPVENLRGGARYLRQQLDEFGRVDLALAAYNAGPGHVRSRRAVPPFRETLNYVLQTTRAWSRAEAAAARQRFPRAAQVLAYTSPRTPNPM